MKSAKALFSTLLVVASATAMAQETSMDAAREQRMASSLQDFRTAHPDMALGTATASDSMNAERKAHHTGGAMKHHRAKAEPMPHPKKSMAHGAAPMPRPMTGSPKATTP